ncbi:solute carrier family 22 member 13 [Megalops cyprinoides]|uniref:solute carrier family 22 member 13 n=1 Tax=Megalops cyprinoides TaxID=118141 RepID=UPI0018653B79|nr:solute carrier family 22 member 13 [Megalops cyprinoides]
MSDVPPAMADFGEILRAVGDFGAFQKLLLVGLCLPNVILPFHLYSFMFTQSGSPHHCNTDWILQVSPNLTKEEQLNLTLPRNQDGSFKSCEMFVPVDWDIDSIREHGLNQTTGCRNGWVYDTSVYKATIVSDFDLVCDRANFVGVAQMVFMGGILFGSLIFGPLAESFGRKRATQIPVVLMVFFTVGTGLSPNFYVYLVTQFVVGVSYGGFRVNCIVLATEWIGVTKRSYPSCLSQIFSGVGQSILAGIAYLIRDWRIVQFIIASPVAFVVLYIWLVPESARWLLDRGKTEEAKELILRAAAINKRKIPDNILEKVTNQKNGRRGNIIDLITSPVLRKHFLIITFGWFSLNLSYYCLTLNVGHFGMDIFLTQLIFGFTDIPAHIICVWTLEALGRKISVMFTLLMGGFVCLMILAVPQDNAIAITAFATTGRFFMNWAGTICNIYVQELFPTSIRQTSTGLGAIATRIAGMLSPVLNLLAMYHWTIPTLVYSTCSLASGALCFMLPETRRKELPDSADELERKGDVKTMKKNASHATTDQHQHLKSTKL